MQRVRSWSVAQRRATIAALFACTLLSGGAVALAGGLGGLLDISPGAGPPGTPYTVTVVCEGEPTLFAWALAEHGPPNTIVPTELIETTPGTWGHEAIAGETFDEAYRASCGEVAATSRFDTDVPRLYLGPMRTQQADLDPRTTVEGTDCPDGTTAQVAITAGGETVEHEAEIDQYGDWAVDLPSPEGTVALSIDASCGAVVYATLLVAGSGPLPEPPAALPQAGAPTFVG